MKPNKSGKGAAALVDLRTADILKACPFCGSGNVSVDHIGEDFYLACCEECGATGPGAETWFKAGRLWNERRRMGGVHH